MVHRDGIEQVAGDRLAAVQDRGQRRSPDQVGQAADHAPGAGVQVVTQARQRAGTVMVQPQRSLEGGDQGGPLVVFGERAGVHQHAAAGDLSAAYPSEQAAPFDVDAGNAFCASFWRASISAFVFGLPV